MFWREKESLSGILCPKVRLPTLCSLILTPVEAKFLSDDRRVFSPLTAAEACEKNSRWLWKESCVSSGMRKPGNTRDSPTAMT